MSQQPWTAAAVKIKWGIIADLPACALQIHYKLSGKDCGASIIGGLQEEVKCTSVGNSSRNGILYSLLGHKQEKKPCQM